MDFGKEERIIPNESGMDYNSSTNNWLQQQQSSAINAGVESSSENMLNTSPLSTSSNGNAEMRSNDSGDAEGVWSPDIDQAFHEALQIYPPCGRRKIILSDEGKMYGRNELIARYIKIRCGKTRTRKQVSSHIQVLARKKQREEHARIKAHREGGNLPDASNLARSANGSLSPNMQQQAADGVGNQSAEMEVFQAATDMDSNLAPISSGIQLPTQPLANLITSVNRNQITSMHAQMLKAASAITMGTTNPSWPYNLQANNLLGLNNQLCMANGTPLNSVQVEGLASTSAVVNNLIASSRLSLIEFSAYITQNLKGEGASDKTEIVNISKISDAPLERINIDLIQSKYPPILQELFKKGPTDAFFLAKCWANMNFDYGNEQNSLFAVDSYYESAEKFDITVSTKVCSFGNEVVEKVEVYSPTNDDVDEKSTGTWHFKLYRSPMCEYMVRFISELKKLQEPSLMNSVLENFTVLQIVTNKKNDETLMVLAFIFDIREDGEDEIYTHIYRLTDESS